MDSHQRQKFLNPFSLRAAQLFLDCTQSNTLITEAQKKKITPFFIIGSGRSGNTLMRSVLQRNPAVNIPPESHSAITNSVKKFYRYGGLEWKDLVSVTLGEFASQTVFDLWNIDLLEVQRRASALPEEEQSLAKIVDLLHAYHMETHKPEATIWGDKTPFLALRLKWVEKVFPNARYLNMIRDGRDVVSSYLAADLADSLDEACERWNLSIEKVEQFQKKSPGSVLTIYYEEFVNDPETTVREVCEFLDISFDPEMLENDPVYLGDNHLKHHENVNKPISNRSVGKWKERLTDQQQRDVEKKLAGNLKRHGYQ
ncbi:sulfotransferase [Aliifodinibius sp. S!AR15-10]|uniref:sulfotransferase family protein n=1 Tax=Aliifodinibius sp. S!AR15-10 TaxID=2950437 RepID=UPI00285846D7|nr:sulfotransferase [Aliifodinibius sp. S!AR15-10]MDR8394600.1 sulfotransferase [Aliifodinibius sp. S!AR15-10]